MQKVALSAYRFFVFMNGSIRGPFIGCDKSKKWLNEFTSRLSPSSQSLEIPQKTPPVHLIGTSFNCHIPHVTDCADVSCVNRAHLQSMFLVIDDVGISLAEKTWGCVANKLAVIDTYEIGTTRKFLAEGWNVAAIQEYWQGHNFLDENSTHRKCLPIFRGSLKHWKKDGRVVTDPYYPGNEWTPSGRRDVPPTEMIMFKANRQVGLKELTRLTEEGSKCNAPVDAVVDAVVDPRDAIRSDFAVLSLICLAPGFALFSWRSRRSIWRCLRSRCFARYRQV